MRATPGRAGPLSLGTIVTRLGGRVSGNAETVVSQVGSLENAGGAQIAFLSNPRYQAKLAETHAGAVVLAPSAEGLTSLPRIVAYKPYAYFARVSPVFNPDPDTFPPVQEHTFADHAPPVRCFPQLGSSAHEGSAAPRWPVPSRSRLCGVPCTVLLARQ